jgi:hypothetical protein
VRGAIAINVSGSVPECFFFARTFCPQVVEGGAVSRMARSKRQPQDRLPLFILTAARIQYGLSMVGANGLEPATFSLAIRIHRSAKENAVFSNSDLLTTPILMKKSDRENAVFLSFEKCYMK